MLYITRAFFINERSLECVCYTFIWIDQIKRHKKQAEEKFFCTAKVALLCKRFITDFLFLLAAKLSVFSEMAKYFRKEFPFARCEI